jgi:SAM-dependent methyltransferase
VAEKKTAQVLRVYLKYLLYRLQLAPLLHRVLFWLAQQQQRKQNNLYRQAYPGLVIPPDQHIYETYQLDYRKFIADGEVAAQEIVNWTKPYLPQTDPRILDWGCGVGRIIRHLPGIVSTAQLYGADANEEMISWNKTHYPDISFTSIHSFPPTPYAPDFFDLVYGFSVLTHIAASAQEAWIEELHRILRPGGVLLLTTHGTNYTQQLRLSEKRQLSANGIYTRPYPQQGHRMMTSWHQPFLFRQILAPYFEVREMYEGKEHPQKAGGHDLWILQKKVI